jgi:uncharacterized phage infection (PIP) family protein YhgE
MIFTPSVFPLIFWPFAVIILFLTGLALVRRLQLYRQLKGLVEEIQDYLTKENLTVEIDPKTGKSSVRKSIPSTAKPDILEELEKRYRNACAVLEQVNTIALVRQIFKNQKLDNISYEKVDYFCRLVPNLLIASGLMGTFLGITLNLTQVHKIINNSQTTEIQELIVKLKPSLQSMGLAFGTSLLALAGSVLLSVLYYRWNTSLMQARLLILLEDYLDNIYQPTVEGHTRLDKVVDKMEKNFDVFLANFGTTVRVSVEEAFRGNLTRLTEAHENLAEQAIEMYASFRESSSTFDGSANTMRATVQKFQNISQNLTSTINQLSNTLKNSSSELANTQRELSQSVMLLYSATQSNDQAVTTLKSATENVLALADGIGELNQNSSVILETTRHNQDDLAKIIPQLNQGIDDFLTALEILNQLKAQAEARESQLESYQSDLQTLAKAINDANLQVEAAVNGVNSHTTTVNEILTAAKSELVVALNDNVARLDTVIKTDIVEKLTNNSGKLDSVVEIISSTNKTLSERLVQALESNSRSQAELVDNISHNLIEELQRLQSALNTLQNETLAIKADMLGGINSNFEKLNSVIEEISSTSKDLVPRLSPTIESLGLNQTKLLNNLQKSSSDELQNLRIELKSLVNMFAELRDYLNQLGATENDILIAINNQNNGNQKHLQQLNSNLINLSKSITNINQIGRANDTNLPNKSNPSVRQ